MCAPAPVPWERMQHRSGGGRALHRGLQAPVSKLTLTQLRTRRIPGSRIESSLSADETYHATPAVAVLRCLNAPAHGKCLRGTGSASWGRHVGKEETSTTPACHRRIVRLGRMYAPGNART
jgi:hypothetical protein